MEADWLRNSPRTSDWLKTLLNEGWQDGSKKCHTSIISRSREVFEYWGNMLNYTLRWIYYGITSCGGIEKNNQKDPVINILQCLKQFYWMNLDCVLSLWLTVCEEEQRTSTLAPAVPLPCQCVLNTHSTVVLRLGFSHAAGGSFQVNPA